MEFKTDSTNQHFNLAVQFVNNTAENIFLTGKAGTGKTTFLKYISKHCHKKMAIVAPTGVAAINAGGVTIHSLFQMPFGIFAPVKKVDRNLALQGVNDQYSLIENMRLNSKKRDILQELELLIIDEVSMVRADLLDAIDTMLRHFRYKPHVPFGGVQMLFIGDMFQLPPVVNNNDWQILKQFYKSPFFFDSKVIEVSSPIYLELKHIYRQDNPLFINILNNIRNNKVLDSDLETLHQRYKPGYQPDKNGEYITLSTHNAKADTINATELEKLASRIHTFDSEIRGEFNEKALPAEPKLQLKVGSQIMFIKNDKGEVRRYYNGKIGIISRIDEDEIYVKFVDGIDELKVEKETWTNIRYNYNQEKDIIEEEELGAFTQYPIRLAWAITIHKSQGLTFEKAIIDAGESFAAGQVYVALSRMTSLDGMILYSKINKSVINTDERVIEFTKRELAPNQLEEILKKEQAQYLNQTVVAYFEWTKIVTEIEIHWEGYSKRQILLLNEAQELFSEILKKVKSQHDVANKFISMLVTLLPQAHVDNYEFAKSRIKSATDYFNKIINEEVLTPISTHLNEVRNRPKSIKYSNELRKLIKIIDRKVAELEQANFIIESLSKGVDSEALLSQITEQNKDKKSTITSISEAKSTEPKAPKGESQRVSLAMFKANKSIWEISKERNMALGTIETHLSGFLVNGEIELKELVAEIKSEKILAQLNKMPTLTSAELKEILGEEISWFEIRLVRAEFLRQNP